MSHLSWYVTFVRLVSYSLKFFISFEPDEIDEGNDNK